VNLFPHRERVTCVGIGLIKTNFKYRGVTSMVFAL
jgi:hypothetical protein